MLPDEILEHADDGKPLALELVRLDGLVDRFGYQAIVREVIEAGDHPMLFAMLYLIECRDPGPISRSLIDHDYALRARGFPKTEHATWAAEARSFLLHRAKLLN